MDDLQSLKNRVRGVLEDTLPIPPSCTPFSSLFQSTFFKSMTDCKSGLIDLVHSLESDEKAIDKCALIGASNTLFIPIEFL